MTLGARLRQLRQHYKLNQEQLGDLCGVTKSNVSQWESDAVTVPTDRLATLRGKLDFSLDWLISGNDSPPWGQREPVQALLRIAEKLPDYAVVQLTREGDTYAQLITSGKQGNDHS